MMSLRFSKKAGDSRQTPIHVGFVKFSRLNTLIVKRAAQPLEMTLVSNSQVNVRGVVVVRSTELVSKLYCRVPGLYGLLRLGNVSTGDGVQICFGNLRLHDFS
jgi:hypothetical protein